MKTSKALARTNLLLSTPAYSSTTFLVTDSMQGPHLVSILHMIHAFKNNIIMTTVNRMMYKYEMFLLPFLR